MPAWQHGQVFGRFASGPGELVRNPGRLVPGNVLHQQVWGPAQESQAGHLRFHLARLRRKLEPEPSHLRQLITETGMGYRYRP